MGGEYVKVAHSITLTLSALNIIELPQKPTEAVIALSVLFLAYELVKDKKGVTANFPWIVSFCFGLLHGFGFATALKEIGIPDQEVLLALASFNIGVELGQLIFIFFVLLFFKIFQIHPFLKRKVIPYCIGSVAAYWFLDRLF